MAQPQILIYHPLAQTTPIASCVNLGHLSSRHQDGIKVLHTVRHYSAIKTKLVPETKWIQFLKHCYVEQKTLKIINTVRFNLNEIQEETELIFNDRNDNGLSLMVLTAKGSKETFTFQRNILYLDKCGDFTVTYIEENNLNPSI